MIRRTGFTEDLAWTRVNVAGGPNVPVRGTAPGERILPAVSGPGEKLPDFEMAVVRWERYTPRLLRSHWTYPQLLISRRTKPMPTIFQPPAAAQRTLLPNYAHPPVVESFLTVGWERPVSLTPELLAAFQENLGPEWPGPARELTSGWEWEDLLQDQLIRVTAQDWTFGWSGWHGGHYPRYQQVRDRFIISHAHWEAAAEAVSLALPQPNRWSVTYLNRIPQGTVWTSAEDWSFFRPLSADCALRGQLPSAVRGTWVYPLPAIPGELQVDFEEVIAASTELSTAGEREIWLRLTARGTLADADELLGCFDAGRTAIVSSFAALTTEEAQQYWGLAHVALPSRV